MRKHDVFLLQELLEAEKEERRRKRQEAKARAAAEAAREDDGEEAEDEEDEQADEAPEAPAAEADEDADASRHACSGALLTAASSTRSITARRSSSASVAADSRHGAFSPPDYGSTSMCSTPGSL